MEKLVQRLAMPDCFCPMGIGILHLILTQASWIALRSRSVAVALCRAIALLPLFFSAHVFSVQRASFFAAADENHRPVSAASSSDQAEDQLSAQIKPYTG